MSLLTNSWIGKHAEENNSSLHLFCFPYAGGGASVFRPWIGLLPPGVELCPVQLPGRESRWAETPFTSLPELIRTLAVEAGDMLRPPFALFGHSLGGIVAFELCRELRRMGRPGPERLFVSAVAAPHLPPRAAPLHRLPDVLFLNRLFLLKGIPKEVAEHPELMQLLLPTLRADVQIFETYTHVPEEPLDCPISAYSGRHDTRVTYEELVAWSCHTRGRFSFRIFPGDHFFLESARTGVLQAVVGDLAETAQQAGAGG